MSFSSSTTVSVVVALLAVHVSAYDVDSPVSHHRHHYGYSAIRRSHPFGREPHMISGKFHELNQPEVDCSPYPPDMPKCVIPLEDGICECGVPCNRQWRHRPWRRHRRTSEPPPCPCGLGIPPRLTDCTCVAPEKESYVHVVQKLKDKLDRDPELNAAFTTAINDLIALDVSTAQCITSVAAYLSFADQILKTPPYQSGDTRNVYDILSTFYLVVDMPSLVPFQSAVQPGTTQGGRTQQQLSFLSEWLRDFSLAWGNWLDTEASTACVNSFATDSWYCWNDFAVPDVGFKTYNQYFSRHFCNADLIRPVNCSDEPGAVVFPADSTFAAWYRISWHHKIDTTTSEEAICAKGAKWSIRELLFRSKYRNQFAGGVFAHAFLSTYNYHRWHAPVAGKIVERRVITGQFYLNVSTVTDSGDIMPYIRDDTGYQFLQQRGLIVIDTTGKANIGYVAALPIGMAQVSSIKFSVQVGDTVEKGDELGYFLFGGSDFVVVFQKKADFHVTAEKNVQSYVRQLYGWIGPPPETTPACALPPPIPATPAT